MNELNYRYLKKTTTSTITRNKKNIGKRKSVKRRYSKPKPKKTTTKRASVKHFKVRKPSSQVSTEFGKDVVNNATNVVCIGDIHGDLDALIIGLKKAHIINSAEHWIAGNTILVQNGDITDMKSRSMNGIEIGKEIKIFNFLIRLHDEAKISGGYVYILLGNHELMNISGILEYASEENIKNFGGYKKRIELFKPGGKIAKVLTAYTFGMIKINGFVFVHGGIPLNFRYSIEDYNFLIKKYLLGRDKRSPDDKIFEPMWDRRFGLPYVSQNDFEKVMRKMDAYGMVVGHTIQSAINQRFKGRLWRVDTGMSRCFGKDNYKRIQLLKLTFKKNQIDANVIV